MQGSVGSDLQKRTDTIEFPVGRVDATPTIECQCRVPSSGALAGTTWQGFPAGQQSAQGSNTLTELHQLSPRTPRAPLQHYILTANCPGNTLFRSNSSFASPRQYSHSATQPTRLCCLEHIAQSITTVPLRGNTSSSRPRQSLDLVRVFLGILEDHVSVTRHSARRPRGVHATGAGSRPEIPPEAHQFSRGSGPRRPVVQ